MKKLLILVFGIVAYLVFLPTFLYLIAFVGNLQMTPLAERLPALAWLVPNSVSYGREADAAVLAVALNLVLVGLFGLQHSVMARIGFKGWLKRWLPKPAERSVYVLISSLVLILLFWQWRPLPAVVWSVEAELARVFLWIVFASGFGLVFISTFLIDHFDLVGLKQVWLQFSGKRYEPPGFVTPMFYRVVRHPLYLGFLMAFWATPHMTLGHLLFAAGMTTYILVGVRLEERDLEYFHGQAYRRYREQVPKLVPVPGRTYRGQDAGGSLEQERT